VQRAGNTKMEIKDAALYLLILKTISSVALLWVLAKQARYLRENNPPEEQKIRLALAGVTVILISGNIIPILIDLLTLFGSIKYSAHVLNTTGIIYTFSYGVFAVVVGLAWAFFYWLADREKVYLKEEVKELHQEVDDLHQTATDVSNAQDVKDVKSAKVLKEARKKQ